MDISTNIIYLVDPLKLSPLKKKKITLVYVHGKVQKYENNQEIS